MRWFHGRCSVVAIAFLIVLSTALTDYTLAASDNPEALKALIEQAKKEPNAINGSMTRVLLSTPDLIKKANALFNPDSAVEIFQGDSSMVE